jgi:hypothetical protein
MNLRPWDYWEVGGETPNEVGAQFLAISRRRCPSIPIPASPRPAPRWPSSRTWAWPRPSRAARDSGTGAATPWAVTWPRPDRGPGGALTRVAVRLGPAHNQNRTTAPKAQANSKMSARTFAMLRRVKAFAEETAG